LESGVESEMPWIRDRLDKGLPFETPKNPKISVHSIAESLILFLELLVDSVVPQTLAEKSISCETEQQCKLLIETFLPKPNFAVFYYLISFLKQLILAQKPHKYSYSFKDQVGKKKFKKLLTFLIQFHKQTRNSNCICKCNDQISNEFQST